MAEGNGAAPARDTRLDAVGIAPSFTVNDLEESLRFYTEALGFEIEDRTEFEGVTVFVMLKAGGAQLGLGQDDFAKGRDRVKGVGMRVWIPTNQDVTVIAARVKAAGYALDNEPEPLPWGPMAFAVTDPDGFKLTIAGRS